MSKERNDWFVVIIFSLIWIVRPISYDEMRSRHPIYLQENVVVVNSSSISTQNDELEFLESKTKEIILAKDTNESFFAEGFSPPLPKRPGSRTPNGIGASNPGSGGDSSAPSSGNLDESCPSNPTPKFPHQLSSNNQNKKRRRKTA